MWKFQQEEMNQIDQNFLQIEYAHISKNQKTKNKKTDVAN